jgi:hypothetical protein
VPLLFLELGSVQAAVDRAADMIRSSVRRFDEAESEILASFSHDPEALESIRKFIEGCKFACTANLNWR